MSGPMGLVYPTPGDTSDTWGVVLNTLLGQFGGGVENHNHTSGNGNPIPAEALSIDEDVSWGQHAITAMTALGFTEVAPTAVTGYTDALFVSSSDHNLYFRNQGGTNVQLTAGNTLNVSIVGGIGGDYSSVGALLSYQDSSRSYLLQQEGSPRPWAALQTGDILLYQKAASIANAITLKSPNSLAASYTVTMPATLPASTSPLYVTSSGGTQFTRAETLIIPAIAGFGSGAAAVIGAANVTTTGGNNDWGFPICLPAGALITGYLVRANKVTSNTTTLTSKLYFVTGGTTGGGTPTTGASNSGNAPGSIILAEGTLAITVTAGQLYWVDVAWGAGTGDHLSSCEITYVTAGG